MARLEDHGSTTDEPEPPRTARFEIGRRLGSGAMGVVYAARDREKDAVVALKTLRYLNAQSIYRFKREFRALADLRHPNLVRLDELICDEGQWLFTMELVEGRDFLSWAASLDDEARLREGLRQLAEGLAALHAAGKVHRDIKPSNILVTLEGRVVLLDFGVVGELLQGGAASETVIGTVAYMAPEQGAGRGVTAAADWYAMGVVIYEALTGSLPFTGTPFDVLTAKQTGCPPPPSARAEHVPPPLEALCMDLLAPDPEDRPTGAEILARLGVPDGLEPSHSSPPPAPPAFVGRRHELAVLEEALARVRGGRTVVMYVRGESGIGKSALVRHFLTSLGPDAVVLSGRCYERESVPFKAFDGMIDALSRHLKPLDPVEAALLLSPDVPLLARLFPVMRRVPAVARAPEPAAPVAPADVRARAVEALRHTLAALGSQRLLVLSIDDFQEAGADSLRLLRELLEGSSAPRMLVLATIHHAHQQAAHDPLIPVEPWTLDVPPLSGEESAQLAALIGGELVDAAAIARDAAGHPFFIHELVRHHREHANTPAAVQLADVIRTRVEALTDPARSILEVVALAGAPVEESAVAEAVHRPVAEARRVIGELQLAGLLRSAKRSGGHEVEPYHDRVRHAVVGQLTAEHRAELHAAIARALESAGAAEKDPRSLVHHLMAAGRTDAAAIHAERAAYAAYDNLAFDQAAALYRIAVDLGHHDDAAGCALRVRLGDSLRMSGRSSDAAAAYVEAAPLADPATRLQCRRLAAEHYLFGGHLDEGLTALEDVLGEIGERFPRTPRGALLSFLRTRAVLAMRGRGWRRRDDGEIAPRDLMRVDVYASVALGLGMVDSVRGSDFQVRGLLAALRAGEPIRIARALGLEAMYLATRGASQRGPAEALVDQAEGLVDRDTFVRISASPSSNIPMAAPDGVRGVIAFLCGDYLAAERLLRESLAEFDAHPVVGHVYVRHTGRIFWLLSLRHLGRLTELRESFEAFRRDAVRRGDRYTETSLVRGLALVWLLDDDPETARGQLERELWHRPTDTFHLQDWYRLMSRVDLALYTGAGATAMEQLGDDFARTREAMLTRIVSVRTITCWLRGRLALAEAEAIADRRGPLRVARRMAQTISREGIDSSLVWSHLLEGAVARLQQDEARAAAELERASEIADRAGVALYGAVARYRLGELLGGEDGDAMRDEAARWLSSQGARDPARIVAVYAPGF